VTPLEPSAVLSKALGCEVLLKCDHLQPTGSFKLRGATNKVRTLSEAARRAGVTTASTGNYGQAVARAGALAGVHVVVYVAASTVPSKMDAIRALGAELVVVDGPPIEAELLARQRAGEQGKTYLPPYNDLDVVAGQGTLGADLVSGVGTALKRLSPKTRIVGVWPENSPCMLRALEAGRIVDVEERDTLSDGTAGAVEAGSITFPLCQAVIDARVTVTEAEIAAAMRWIAETERWIVEGAAGVAMAGLMKTAEVYRGGRVAVVLCGRNISFKTFRAAMDLTPG